MQKHCFLMHSFLNSLRFVGRKNSMKFGHVWGHAADDRPQDCNIYGYVAATRIKAWYNRNPGDAAHAGTQFL